jgi:hypothetical protein
MGLEIGELLYGETGNAGRLRLPGSGKILLYSFAEGANSEYRPPRLWDLLALLVMSGVDDATFWKGLLSSHRLLSSPVPH